VDGIQRIVLAVLRNDRTVFGPNRQPEIFSERSPHVPRKHLNDRALAERPWRNGRVDARQRAQAPVSLAVHTQVRRRERRPACDVGGAPPFRSDRPLEIVRAVEARHERSSEGDGTLDGQIELVHVPAR
jgi:hypothetical protein